MSRNEPKTAKGRQGTNNTQTSTKPVNKDLETYRKQIDSVKNIITNWNEEDILKVLERCGFEPDLAVSTIIDGYEGEQPTQWKEVTRKVKTEKSKDKKRDQGRPRGPRKTNENKDNNDKKTDRRSGPKEGQSVNGSTQHRGSKEHMENKEKDSQVKESNENSKEVPPQQPVSVPVVSQPKDTWAQKLQMDLNNHQKSSHPTKREEEHRKAAEHNQQAKPQAAPKKEEVKKENPPSSVQQAQPTPTDNSFNQQYPSARQYNPPGMKWKPKESKSSDNESPLPQTSNPVHSNANSIVQAQSQTVRQAPSQTTTQKVISAPVVLPSVLAAEIDASDLQFGNFNNGAYERQETTQITNLTTSTTTANNHVETTITEQHVQVREQETAVPQQQMPIPQQQGAPGFTYMPLTGRPNFVGNYGAQMSHYSGFDGEMNHFTPYDQEAITARQQMMPFDPQSVIPPPSFTHTREPSPSDSNKYVSRSDSNQGFRDTNKFSQQQEQTPNTNTTAPGVTPNAQQQAYGYSPAMYAYPYINPYNNPNSQYYPRFYPRTYIPNNPQGYPAPTTSSNLYAEEMVQPEYGKNMFSAMPSFFQPTDQSMNLVGKNQPSHLHQTTTPGKSQSFSPPPTVPQQGATSPEIQPNSYKAPQMSFNTGRETTSAPSAYYNNMAQQQYQQTSNFPYMMPQQQPFPRGGQQQQYMQN